jgi:hypothetical protein
MTAVDEGEPMPLFQPENATATPRRRRLYAIYELVYTAIDLSAALLFIVGSVMFFSDAWQTAGTWCFLVGSIFFAFKPTLRVVREIHFYRIGDLEDLAKRARG